ncbi:hypothetical protein GWK47_027065 [Chionoecetes opilio]|uniref:Uncharacterized protein n=1 Tax=Chionoecetes opilio TaxID=41210 RepID=A0A8J8WKY7_CHIOP|nr:hypothetical protein GWK47_027065 [Chionoecetes opilio]
MHVPPSLQQLKAQGDGPQRNCAHQTHPRAGPGRGAAGTPAATDLPPTGRPPPPPATPRAYAHYCIVVRLGYCTREELQEDFEGQVCDHCEMHTRRPLVHYLLSCPATAPLRPGPAPAAQPAGGGLLSGREGRATLMVRHTPRDVMLGVLRAAPPPR